ncbi:uncharacterized protein si:dkey-52l18.4 [Acanthopagrus latus]|uniref:uncharacterized protein si:dkey-52l18.4 n=1 Tax=Acanthopagrus latus TaxID=8177 RepID=UPI00187BE6F5|nr:uncharacterized protein si:dkey-52l18.4 [Acanthopagrus latus]
MTSALLQSDMTNCLLSAISCLCLLLTCVRAEECSPTVLAARDTFAVPAGGRLSLSCVVQHCGKHWTGHWVFENSTHDGSIVVKESARHRLTHVNLSGNKTQQILELLSINQSDKGFYGCSVKWSQRETEQGHLTYVNVTAAVPSQRSLLHRLLVCASASLCLPIILGLARCLSPEVKPQPLPRTPSTHAAVYHPAPQPPPRCPVPQKRSAPPRKARPKYQQKTEVVYADISQGALRQEGAIREAAQSTVYSDLRFS